MWYAASRVLAEPRLGGTAVLRIGSGSPAADESRLCVGTLDIRRSQSTASIVNAGRAAVEISTEPVGAAGEDGAISTVTVSCSTRGCTGGRDAVATATSG